MHAPPTWLAVFWKGQSAAGLAEVPEFDGAITRRCGQNLSTGGEGAKVDVCRLYIQCMYV